MIGTIFSKMSISSTFVYVATDFWLPQYPQLIAFENLVTCSPKENQAHTRNLLIQYIPKSANKLLALKSLFLAKFK